MVADDRPPETLIHESEIVNGRRFAVEVRPGMTEGQHLGLMLRCWGQGHWSVASGEPHHYTARAHALDAGGRWLAEGKR